jgi:hypothetical protein
MPSTGPIEALVLECLLDLPDAVEVEIGNGVHVQLIGRVELCV